MSRFTAVLIASGASFAVGYVAGLLSAPNSGQESRDWVVSRAREQTQWVEEQLRKAESQVKMLEEQMNAADAGVAWDVEPSEVERDLRRMPH